MTVPLLYLKTRHQHRRGRAGPLSQRRQDVSGRAQENKVRFATVRPEPVKEDPTNLSLSATHLFTPAETQLPSYAGACGPPIEMKIVSSLRLEMIFDGVARHRGVLGSFDLALSSLGDW
jgi:hypothetical protein